MTTNMLEIKSLKHSYAGQFSLDSLNFNVKAGNIHGFLGPNGAGKSTTIKLISSLLSIEEGDVKVDGISVLENTELTKPLIGVLLENAPLFLDMKVKDYLVYMAKLHRVEKSKVKEYVEDCLKKMNLKHVENRIINNLSRGYKQRVGVAQAIVHKPKLVILDEPSLGLDPQSIKDMRELIVSLKGDHTFLISSHHLHEIEQMCDEVTIINEGKILYSGSTQEFKSSRLKSKQLILKVLDASQAIELLTDLDFVLEVVKRSDDILITFKGNDQQKVELSKLCVQNNLGLMELKELELSLEEIFLLSLGGEQ